MPASRKDDPERVAFIQTAVRNWANAQTIMGINLGAHLSDELCASAVNTVLEAEDAYDNAKEV